MLVASKVGNLHSKFGHSIGLWVLELFAMYATDGQTDGRTGKSNAYCPLHYGGSIIVSADTALSGRDSSCIAVLVVVSSVSEVN